MKPHSSSSMCATTYSFFLPSFSFFSLFFFSLSFTFQSFSLCFSRSCKCLEKLNMFSLHFLFIPYLFPFSFCFSVSFLFLFQFFCTRNNHTCRVFTTLHRCYSKSSWYKLTCLLLLLLLLLPCCFPVVSYVFSMECFVLKSNNQFTITNHSLYIPLPLCKGLTAISSLASTSNTR